MRGMYINLTLATLNLVIGIWFIDRRLDEIDTNWISLILQAPMNLFVAGYCYMNAYRCYRVLRRVSESPAPIDLGVNWSRDGF
jgi:hypothetical protein